MSCFSCVADSSSQQPHGFLHGVASFDPLPTAILLWTRITPPPSLFHNHTANVQIQVDWEISTSKDFPLVGTKRGVAPTSADRDFTVCVDVTGLEDYTRYYYRFHWANETSPVGLTKTTTAGTLEEMKIVLVSCANFEFGNFHVYDLATRLDGIDLVVHCGDYIYEYAPGVYPAKFQRARTGLRPKAHCTSLEDYRSRYACYRQDPALQKMHQNLAMVAVWDDHEIGDDAYRHGSENFEGSPEEFQKRKLAALQAYLEWVPIRGQDASKPSPAACHRTFQFGDLATLMLVENRSSCRMEPVQMPETQFYNQVAKKKVKDWDDDAASKARDDLRKQLHDPNRVMLGDEQVADVATAVEESVARGQPWQILVSQTILSRVKAPRLIETLQLQPKLLRWVCSGALRFATKESIAGEEGAAMARMYMGMGKYGVEMNPSAWDGYQAERERLLKALDIPGSNPIVLAGDSHNAWAHAILNEAGHRVGVEFDGPAVTSIGAFEDVHARFESKMGILARMWPLYLFSPWITDALLSANPDTLEYCNLTERGLVVLHLKKNNVHTEYHFVNNVYDDTYKNHCEAAFAVEAGVKGRLQRVPRYLTVDGCVPKRTRQHRNALVHGIHDVSASMREYKVKQ